MSTPTKDNSGGLFFVAIAIVAAAWILGHQLIEMRKVGDTIAVTGSAKRPIVSDLIIWSGNLNAQESTQQEAYRAVQKHTERLARFFKLARYSPGMRSLAAALKAERKALGASAVIIFGVVLVMASAMHIAEHAAQPDKFGSIPESMWWAVVTITTVGYGDVVPVTVIGKMIAGVTAFMGFLLLALPVGIVATAFAEEIHRREFVVTWSMIAHVPLFATLDASEIAEIMHYLRAQTVPAGTIVVRRGEEAHCMYFVAAGEVEVDLPHNAVRLGEGQFFGEIAVMRKTRRTATVRTTLPSKLLVLDAGDLGTLMARNPEIGRRIEEAIAAYGEIPALAPRGDMAADEVGQPTGDS